MKHRSALLSLVAGLCLIATAFSAAAEVEWQPLFNGENLDGWTQRNGTALYKIEDGAIVGYTVAGSPNSFLCTDQTYANFVLELEFRLSDPDLNSGVQIRSHTRDNAPNGRVYGYQVEIDAKPRAWTAGIYEEAARGWLYNLEGQDDAREAYRQGEWNTLYVVAMGNVIRTWLNDVPAAFLVDDQTAEGFIALQVHGIGDRDVDWNVSFRNLRIKDYGHDATATHELLGPALDTTARPPFKGATALLGADGDLSNLRMADGSADIKWNLDDDGVLEVVPRSGSVITAEPHRDFFMHVEYAVPHKPDASFQDQGNSGVYIQRRYEIQILDSYGKSWEDMTAQDNASIYLYKKPDANASRPAGEWNTYDIVFRAARWNNAGEKTEDARVSLLHNGQLVHRDVALPNKTGAGVAEGPNDLPILLQEHGNAVRFRNVWIAPLDLPSPPSGLSARVAGDELEVHIDGALFTAYKFTDAEKYPFFYPVVGPRSGKSVTIARSEPYPHHSSLFFGCDRVNGGNYWQEGLDRGQILSQGPKIVTNGPDRVVFTDTCLWAMPGQDPIIRDERRVEITAPSADLRIIDFHIAARALVPVTIQRTNHALFSARMVPELSVQSGGTLVNSQGQKNEAETFGVVAPWCDYFGTRDGVTEGLAIFQNPANPEYPFPWFTRNYGFFSPMPLNWIEEDVQFSEGEVLELSYRVIVHGGDTEEAGIANLFDAYRSSAY